MPTYTFAQIEHAAAQALGLGLMQQRSVLRALSLILTELGGMDPTTVTAVVKNQWPTVARTIELVAGYEARSGTPYHLCVWSQTMTGPWLRKPAISIAVLQFQTITPWGAVTNSQLLQLAAENPDRWFAAYNLTRIFTRAETALPSKS